MLLVVPKLWQSWYCVCFPSVAAPTLLTLSLPPPSPLPLPPAPSLPRAKLQGEFVARGRTPLEEVRDQLQGEAAPAMEAKAGATEADAEEAEEEEEGGEEEEGEGGAPPRRGEQGGVEKNE